MEGIDRIPFTRGKPGADSARASFQDIIPFPASMKPTDPVAERPIDNTPPNVPVPDYRPVERFWPYVDLPEQPTEEELAALNPELAEALFGTPPLPFSVVAVSSKKKGPNYALAVQI